MFFTAIHQMMTESVDLTIVIRKTNGQLTVSTLPKSNGLKDEARNLTPDSCRQSQDRYRKPAG